MTVKRLTPGQVRWMRALLDEFRVDDRALNAAEFREVTRMREAGLSPVNAATALRLMRFLDGQTPGGWTR